jgi:hypothetical protein
MNDKGAAVIFNKKGLNVMFVTLKNPKLQLTSSKMIWVVIIL